MFKKVLMYVKPQNSHCDEVKEYLADQDISLQVRDVSSDPLKQPEITRLLRHFDLKHFLDTDSKVYKRNKMDKLMPTRDEIINLMVEDNDLLRVPILVSGRLMTIGCNREKITEMLQIRNNGPMPARDDRPRQPRINRRTKK
ncbi:MAG: hypothetical protein GY865_16270 [candidate division Zixibacteria bacterium]|nr:hypothetical protein [candidate division Zixibacteria bacterium]